VSVIASYSKRCCLWPEDGPLRNGTCSHCKLYVNTTFVLAVLCVCLCLRIDGGRVVYMMNMCTKDTDDD
jgi:hypothetical protein